MRTKPFFVLLAALGLAVCAPSGAGAETAIQPGPVPASATPLRLAIPSDHAYGGAYIEFGDREDTVTLEKIEHFDTLVHRQQAIVAFTSDWGNQSFPERQLRIVANYGAVPLVYWSPWDRPADNRTPPPRRFDLNAILAGTWDSYIDSWAQRARDYGKPLLVAWGLEMNGTWFPWSGAFYGGGQAVAGCDRCFAGPEKYKQTYRYVVDRVRARGAHNICLLYTSDAADE